LIDASSVLRRLSRRSPSINVVPFGVDTQRFSPGSAAHVRRWGDEPTVLFVGRLRYYKGLRYLIEAVAKTSARLVIVGDGQERAQVLSMGRELLGERFTFMPGIAEAELVDAYRSADVFCLPSTSKAEAFGLAALEAMSCGIPVITTEVGTATSEINADGVTGLVVSPANSEELAGAIAQLIDDASLRAGMSGAARQRVLTEYDRALMLRRVSDVYERVLSERSLERDG
jgi:rhamnosyl/mannosyltransferase